MEAVIHHHEQYEEEDKKKARAGIIIWLILLLMILVYPWLTFPTPPPGQEGILVTLGIPDVGDGDEQPAAASSNTPKETPDETPPPEPEPEKPAKAEPTKKDPEPVKTTKDVITDNSEEIALQKKKEKEKRKKEAERKKKEKEKEEARKKEAERKQKEKEAREKKEAERKQKEKEANELKNQLGDLFGGSSGNTGTQGNQGDPNGDPNSDILEGISTGAGKVGGGLSSRGGRGPKITDTSQFTGKVVMRVCVNERGKVISAKFTQDDSTTTNARLIKLAEANAKKWSFNSGDLDKQCGTISYEFKVK